MASIPFPFSSRHNFQAAFASSCFITMAFNLIKTKVYPLMEIYKEAKIAFSIVSFRADQFSSTKDSGYSLLALVSEFSNVIGAFPRGFSTRSKLFLLSYVTLF